MKRIHAILGAAVLAVAGLVLCTAPAARGDRIGGAILIQRTVGPYETLVLNISFLGNRQGSVAISGNSATPLDLVVSDSDGHVLVGSGNRDQKGVQFNVYRTGSFRVEVRNLGPRNNTFYLTTN